MNDRERRNAGECENDRDRRNVGVVMCENDRRNDAKMFGCENLLDERMSYDERGPSFLSCRLH